MSNCERANGDTSFIGRFGGTSCTCPVGSQAPVCQWCAEVITALDEIRRQAWNEGWDARRRATKW